MRRCILTYCCVPLLFLMTTLASGMEVPRAEDSPRRNAGPVQTQATDTMRMKNGSILHGLVIQFENGIFTIVIPGTQSRAMVHVNDVERIEFAGGEMRLGSSAGLSVPSGNESRLNSGAPAIQEPIQRSATENQGISQPQSPLPRQGEVQPQGESGSQSLSGASQPAETGTTRTTDQPVGDPNPQKSSDTIPTFREITVRVPAREVWADSGVDVSKSERLRFSVSGQVSLSRNQVSGPGGVSLSDPKKMMPTRPTGGLIAVIGDDNDDFIFIGSAAEFTARRSGRLFLMVNENNLDDNSGAFIVRIQLQSPSEP